jgi:integrase
MEMFPRNSWNMPCFADERDIRYLPIPKDSPFQEYWHKGDRCFGVRVMRTKRNGAVTRRYICRYRDQEGKDKKKVLGDYVIKAYVEAHYDALALRRELKRRKDYEIAPVPTVLDAWNGFVEAKQETWAKATVAMYKKALINVKPLWKTRADQVTTDDCQNLKKAIQARIASKKYKKIDPVERTGQTTAKETMRLLRAVYNDLVAQRKVDFNPTDAMAKRGDFERAEIKGGWLEDEDFPAFFGWLENSTHASTRAFILVALFMGFRLSLVGSLNWDCVKHERRIYVIPARSAGNKSKKEIGFPISPWIWTEVFQKRWDDPERHERWVIPSPKRKGQPLKSIRGSLVGLKELTGISLTVHSLRRTAATLMHEATGGSDMLVARFLTHKLDSSGARAANTARYIKTRPRILVEAMDKMIELALSLAKATPTL